jgi:hypothetical protein
MQHGGLAVQAIGRADDNGHAHMWGKVGANQQRAWPSIQGPGAIVCTAWWLQGSKARGAAGGARSACAACARARGGAGVQEGKPLCSCVRTGVGGCGCGWAATDLYTYAQPAKAATAPRCCP